MLSSVPRACIYFGVKNLIWLQALTLVQILPREGEQKYDCIKTKTLKGISTFFPVHSLKIHNKTLRKKAPKKMRFQ